MDIDGSAAVKRALMGLMVLIVGAAIGSGAARIAESSVAAEISDKALSLDRWASLTESAALMEAAVNQAILLAGTERPASLARAEADASIQVFETRLDLVDDDPVLTEAGVDMVGQIEQTLAEIGRGEPIDAVGTITPALEASYEVFSNIVSERRRTTRDDIATTADSAASSGLALTALVVFLAPAVIVFGVVQWVRRKTLVPARVDASDAPAAPGLRDRLAEAISSERSDGGEVQAHIGSRSIGSTPVTAGTAAGQAGTTQPASTRASVAQHLMTLDRIRTGTLSLVSGRVDLAPIAGRAAGHISGHAGLVDVLAQRVDVEADPLRVDDILGLLLSASLNAGAEKLALVVGSSEEFGTVAVAGAGAAFDPAALGALEHPDDPEGPVALELAVAGQLARAMGGEVLHTRHEDIALLTLELPLAAG